MKRIEDIEIRFTVNDRRYRWQGGYIKSFDSKALQIHDTKILDKQLLQIKQDIELRVQELIKETKI